MSRQGGSGSTSDYESGNEPMPTRGKIFIAVFFTIVILAVGTFYLFCAGDVHPSLK